MRSTRLYVFFSMLIMGLMTGCSTTNPDATSLASYKAPSAPTRWVPQVSDEPVKATQLPAAEEPIGVGRKLRVGEKVIVELSGIPVTEEDEFIKEIDEHGRINLPYIGKVRISGMTASDSATVIQEMYRNGIFKNVVITVLASDPVFVIQGEVRAPGEYEIKREINLLEAIGIAGGTAPFFNGRIEIHRDNIVKKFKWKTLVDRREQAPLIEPNDMIRLLE